MLDLARGELRIGELARRTGVQPELLRAWERRYGLLRPARSTGGFRLYSAADERRVRAMQQHLARGVAAAQAARLALAEEEAAGERERERPALADLAAQLQEALDRLDESAAHRAFDRLLSAFSLETVLGGAILPYLADLGDRWDRGDVSVAQEHFASNVLRGRLLALARGWGAGAGPRAVLACAPGELHDLGLIAFGLALRGLGWRIAFLGPDTPFESAAETARSLEADLVVISATDPARFRPGSDLLARLANTVRVGIAGTGATPELAEATGTELLELGPVETAEALARGGR